MNLRQIKKREKKQHNEYWDQFEGFLQEVDQIKEARRVDQLKGVQYGESAVYFFEIERCPDWQLIGVLEKMDQFKLYAQPKDWMDEFELETCFFVWEGNPEELEQKDWLKWSKPFEQGTKKAWVQAITGKKRLSEAQAEAWWQEFLAKEESEAEKATEVLFEIKDYARTLRYQIKEIESVQVSDPVYLRSEKEWKTYSVSRIKISVQFKETVEEELQLKIKEQLQAELRDDMYQSRAYEIEIL